MQSAWANPDKPLKLLICKSLFVFPNLLALSHCSTTSQGGSKESIQQRGRDLLALETSSGQRPLRCHGQGAPLADFGALPELTGRMSQRQPGDTGQVKAIHSEPKAQTNQILKGRA